MPGKYVTIEPERLQFDLPATTEQKQTLRIQNSSDLNLVFKIRTTNPARFAVKPNSGLILAKQAHDIGITLQVEEVFKSDDKFQIVVAPVPNEETQQNIERYLFTEKDKKALALQLNDAWKKIPSEKHQKIKLTVHYANTEEPAPTLATANASLASLPAPESNDEVDMLKARVAVLEKELEEAKKVMQDTTELDAALQRVSELEKDLEVARANAEPDDEEVNALKERVAALEKELAEAEEKSTAVAEVDNSDLEEANVRIADLEKELAETKVKAGELDATMMRVSELEKELEVARANAEPEVDNTEVDALKARVAELEKEAEENKAVNDTTELDAALQRVTELEAELKAAETKPVEPNDDGEMDTLKERIATLEKQLAEAEKSANDNTELEVAKKALEALKGDADQLRGDLKDAKTANKKLNASLEEAKKGGAVVPEDTPIWRRNLFSMLHMGVLAIFVAILVKVLF